MAVAVAAPAAVGPPAAPICGGDADGDGGEAPLEVAGKEEVPPPVVADAEGAPPAVAADGEGAAPEEGEPAAIIGTVGGEEEGGEEKEKEGEGDVDGEEEEGEKWLGHYSSAQSILLVGDGDFSFSLALATAFGSGASLVATSLDTYEALRGKYSKAESNIVELKRLGAMVLHGVDAKRMKFHTDLRNRLFDRIVFNFPHAGFKGKEDNLHMINSHRELVWGFFSNAIHLLRPYGEIHVTHKTGWAYDRWDLGQLASESSLVMVEKVPFRKEDYPGYNQKRGDSARCDEPFDLGACFKFKFQIGDLKKRKKLHGNRDGPLPLGSNNVHPGIWAIEIGPFHPFPPAEARLQQHFPPPVNTVHRPITMEPNGGVPEGQHPAFPVDFDGRIRDPYFHQQGAVRPVPSTPGPWLNALPDPGDIPPWRRIPCPDLPAAHQLPWHQQSTVPDQGRDNYFPAPHQLPWHQQRTVPDQGRDNYFERVHQMSPQEYENHRPVMPGATSLNFLRSWNIATGSGSLFRGRSGCAR